MNYLKNRYPFKFLTSFFRLATKPSDPLPGGRDLKRNKSDSALPAILRKSLSKESLNSETILRKKLSKSSSECRQNIEKKSSDHSLKTADSDNSLPHSKTSSEHSFRAPLDRKKTFLDLHYLDRLEFKKTKKALDQELKFKLKKLQRSLGSSVDSSQEKLSEEERPRLKRAYPWQNLNLNSLHQKRSDEDIAKNPDKLLALKHVRPAALDVSIISESNSTLSSKSSNQSLRSCTSTSSTTTERKASRDCLQEIKDQMPYFKSILKKSAYRGKPTKEVTFDKISTSYGPDSSYSHVVQETNANLDGSTSHGTKNRSTLKDNNASMMNKTKNGNDSLKTMKKRPNSSRSDDTCFGKYEPLKEEHSFLYLYNEKRQKTIP